MFIDPVDWGSRYFYLDPNATHRGLFNPRLCKFLLPQMYAFANPRITRGVEMAGAQSGKTQKALVCAFWALDQDPGPTMWVTPNEKFSKLFFDTRIKPSLDMCEPLQRRLPGRKRSVSKLHIDFSTGMFVLANAGSTADLSGKPIRYLIIDEEKDYLPGRVEYALVRTRSKPDLKIWRMSTSKKHEDTIHQAFLGGTQDHWHVKCPRCGHSEMVRWKNFRYTAKGLLCDSICLTCPAPVGLDEKNQPVQCGFEWWDTPEDRMYILDNGQYVSHNPGAPYPSWSYWGAIAPWIAWQAIGQDWIMAMEAKSKGDYEPFKRFLCDTINEPFEEQPADKTPEVVRFPYKINEFKAARFPGEALRGMAVDVQMKDFRVVIRGFEQNAASKLLGALPVSTFDDLRALQIEYAIEDRFVFVDSAHQSEMVYAACVEYGWIAVVGSDEFNYAHPKKDLTGRTIGYVQKPFSSIRDVWSFKKGRNCRLITLATPRLKDITAFFRDGRASVNWEIPSDTPESYIRQVYNQYKVEKVNDRTKKLEFVWPDRREDHYWDCEYFLTGMAIMAGIIKI